jgi:hydroxymethylglutaryl-CoA lyase
MQGWKRLIPTEEKTEYINALLKAGFDTIDFGSFVSPKAIPQMADTAAVLEGLDLDGTSSRLLAIVANERGAKDACAFGQISFLGFPFSVSPTFQQRNTNSTPEESLDRVKEIRELCEKNGKELVVYLSMAFGNPYGDEYHPEVLMKWSEKLTALGVRTLSLADTVGVAEPAQISAALNTLVPAFPGVSIGVHLHSTAMNWKEKLQAAYDAGCTRFDGALKGIGGCPMAGDELTGNMNTEWMTGFFKDKGEELGLDEAAIQKSLLIANKIFV